jgi:hypothetical protein
VEGLFLLPDRTHSETLVWEAKGDRATFEGEHHGYEALVPPAVHRRRIEVEGDSKTVRIRDVVSGGAHELAWSFPLAPCTVTTSVGRAVADFDDCRLEIDIPTAAVAVDEGWYSPSYGVRVRVPLVRARRMSSPGEDVSELTLRVTSP